MPLSRAALATLLAFLAVPAAAHEDTAAHRLTPFFERFTADVRTADRLARLLVSHARPDEADRLADMLDRLDVADLAPPRITDLSLPAPACQGPRVPARPTAADHGDIPLCLADLAYCLAPPARTAEIASLAPAASIRPAARPAALFRLPASAPAGHAAVGALAAAIARGF